MPGFVEDTIAGTTPEDVGCRRAAIVFIDVDLGKPARLALDFVRPALRNGGIIILDDYFAYKGSVTDGVAGAFEAFKAKNPNLVFLRIFDYGYGGQGFVLAAGAAADGAPSGAGSP